MRTWKIVGLLAVSASLAAPPASAQDRNRRVADQIAREIRDAAEAIGTVTTAVDDSLGTVRFRGRDRWAIDRCAPYLERYGRFRVQDVSPYKRRSFRVYGTLEDGRYDDRYGSRDRYDDRYDRRDRYDDRYRSRDSYRDGYGYRSFTCTVRYDGRVKVKTSRARR
jgi:hypothetical protein